MPANKTQFGMPTLIETDTINDCARLCHELGLDFIELNMNMPQYQLAQLDVESLLHIAEKYGIYYTIHLDENFNPCDFNTAVADAYITTATQVIEIAKLLSAPIINMHMATGVFFAMPTERIYLFEKYKDVYLESIKRFRNLCVVAIGSHDIKICIENSSGFLPFQREAINLLLASSTFGLTYDIGHNHSINGLDEPFILEHRDRLTHMHVHDALCNKNHLTLGTGELDLNKYLTLADEQHCRVVLETKTIDGLRRSVSWINKWEVNFR